MVAAKCLSVIGHVFPPLLVQPLAYCLIVNILNTLSSLSITKANSSSTHVLLLSHEALAGAQLKKFA